MTRGDRFAVAALLVGLGAGGIAVGFIGFSLGFMAAVVTMGIVSGWIALTIDVALLLVLARYLIPNTQGIIRVYGVIAVVAAVVAVLAAQAPFPPQP